MPRLAADARRLLLRAVVLFALPAASCSSTEAPDSSPATLAADGSIVDGRPARLRVGTHCGVEYLGLPVNGVFWITDEARGALDWMPDEWKTAQGSGEELITLTIELSADRSQLTASLAGRSVEYRPVVESDPVVECM